MDRVLVYLGQLRGGEQDGRGRAGRVEEVEGEVGGGRGRAGRVEEVEGEVGGGK